MELKNNYKLIVDHRENHVTSGVHNITPKLDLAGVKYSVEQLNVGDYIITNENTGATACVERKVFSDFVGSIYDGRLKNELFKMSQKYEKNFIILVGSLSDLYKSRAGAYKMGKVKKLNIFSKSQLIGQIASISARYSNVKFLQVKDDEEFIELLLKLADKLTDGKEIGGVTVQRAKSHDNIYKNVLMAFPGISEEKANNIIKLSPSWHDFCEKIWSDTFEMDGIGKKTIEMFKTFMGKSKQKV
jgi:ERCC4-type nuclease